MGRESVEAMCSFFASYVDSKEKRPSVAVFQVYCDESGKLNDKRCVIFASLVFEQSNVKNFCQRWSDILAGARISHVSMKDAMNFQGPFKTWRDRVGDRDSLLETLAQLAKNECTLLTKSVMMSDEFKCLDIKQRNRLRDVPYAGFETLVRNVAELAAQRGPRDRFHLIYDLSEEYSVTCVRLFNRLRSAKGQYWDLFPSLSFADDVDFPPLQGSDMYAYTEFRKVTRKPEDEPIIKRLQEILGEGASAGRKDLVYHPGKGLGDGVLEMPIESK